MEQRKVVLFIAESLDGYIATSDHKLEWLFNVDGEGDNGYSKFYETIDTILLGRTTYDWIVENLPGEFPYKGKTCYVFSRTEQVATEDVIFVNADVVEFVRILKQEPGKNIWLEGGSELVASLITEDIIDEMIITVSPVLIGAGIPLFKSNPEVQLNLGLKSVRQYNQFVELHYFVKR